jgi:two-component system CheB/CheR fusion protein
VAEDGVVAVVNQQAEILFGISARDVGRPFRDLDLSYRPLELRRYIEQAQAERRSIRVPNVTHARGSEAVVLEVQVIPLIGSGRAVLGVSHAYHDVTESRRLQDELEQANRQLETAYEELQSTNEELETTNEELQSTVEELETTNEELQSTNEELETMNEELQSTNDELQSINDQLRISTGQLDEANVFLETVLTSLQAGVAVVDPDLRIRMWNRRAEDLWGLRSSEAIGQHFLNLDIGLPVDELHRPIRACLGGDEERPTLELEATNRRGRPVRCRVSCAPLLGEQGTVEGVILFTEAEPVEL